jgi:hypothetical protein
VRDQYIIYDAFKDLACYRSETYRVMITGVVLSPFLEDGLDVGLLPVTWEYFESE